MGAGSMHSTLAFFTPIFWQFRFRFLSGVLCLLMIFGPNLDSRPYGKGLDLAKDVDFKAHWNHKLEVAEVHPFNAYVKDRFRSSPTQGEKPSPLDWQRRGLEWNILYFQDHGADQFLGSPYVAAGVSESLRLDTEGAALELKGRFRAIDYDWFISDLYFRPEDRLDAPQTTSGYALSFGDKVSQVTGSKRLRLNLLRIGNERILDEGRSRRFTLLSGMSHLSLDWFERVRGVDELGLNSSVSTVLAGDPIHIEQGEEALDRSGLGAFLGLQYRSILDWGVSWGSRASYHLLRSQRNHRVLVQRVSDQGLLESPQNRQTEGIFTEGLIDLEFDLHRSVSENYSLTLGFRVLHFLEKSRVSLSGEERGPMVLKGVQASLQRYF
jgi:hypothetical protein